MRDWADTLKFRITRGDMFFGADVRIVGFDQSGKCMHIEIPPLVLKEYKPGEMTAPQFQLSDEECTQLMSESNV